jgi:WhiB family transcriptional regulator, redox-sensing transcriptional regulator
MKNLLASPAAVRDGLLPCLREDPQLWFSDRPAELELAKAHCQPCPLRGACLDGALARREPHGVWGGEIFEQGTITARKAPRGRPPSRSRRTPCTQS